jgi:hypothetical protein
MAVGFWAIIIMIASLTHSWGAFLVAVGFPLTFLYANAALLQFLSEHNWASNGTYPSKSHGRFSRGAIGTPHGLLPFRASDDFAWRNA